MQPATCSGGMQVRADVGANRAIEDDLPPLYARLRSRLRRVLYRYHIPADDCEDLLQTTLLLAVAKWTDIRDPEAWLIGTLQKRCTLYWRARKSNLEDNRPVEELDRECGGEPEQTRRERFTDVGKVWHLLPPTQRTLLVLRFQQGMSPREAAQAVGIAHTSVRKTTSRACQRLREALGKAPPRGTPVGRRAPRQPVAALALAKRLRAEGGAGAAWMTAVDAFTAVKAPHLRAQHSRGLAAAGVALGLPSLAELRVEDLVAYRLTLADKATAVRSQMLYSLRSFLLWAGERGDHALQPDAVCGALLVGKSFRREAVAAEATAEWRAAVEAFLAVSNVTYPTERHYRRRLFKAGAAMGWPQLAALTVTDLWAFRTALLADGRAASTHLAELLVIRCFLAWAREQGWFAVDRDVIRMILQGWNSGRKGPALPSGPGQGLAAGRRPGDGGT